LAKKPLADNPMRQHANDSLFDLDPGIISSLKDITHCPKANSSGFRPNQDGTATFCSGTSILRRVTWFRCCNRIATIPCLY
jgi:hypothetical protein